MTVFREPPQFGPESAAWNVVDTLPIDGARYRIMACQPSGTTESCIATSTDGGKSWNIRNKIPGGSKFSSPALVFYDKQFEDGLGLKPREYLYAAAYNGVLDGVDQYVLGRFPKAMVTESNGWSFLQPDYSWGGLQSAAPMANSLRIGPDGANWKLMNAYAVDGALYMFLTRCVYPWKSFDPQQRHWWLNASVIKSTDSGKTWTRAAQDNYEHPMFPGHRFATPYFVWYGKDGAASNDNADKYVYAVSNNGFFENGDDYVLGRVLRSRLPALSAADWSFYKGGNGMQDGSWARSLDGARPILANPRRSSMTGATYVPALGRYVLVAWHYHKKNFEAAIQDKDLGTVLEFFEAGKPWGPWTKVKSFDTGRLGWYTPIVGQRFQKAVDSHTVTAVLYSSGFSLKPEGGFDATLYKLNYMAITLSTRPLPHKDPDFVGGH
jgi:hypothetical protein